MADRLADQRMEELRTELAKQLTRWEDSPLLAKEFADDIIRLAFRYYPDGLNPEKHSVDG